MADFLGLNAFIEHGTFINIEGKRLSIVSECTSISYILIFASAVIAYPASFKKKLGGVLIGVPVIVLLNLLRIVFLGWLGEHFPSHFNLFHEYLWEGGFLLVVLFLWMIWVNSFTAETPRRREMTTLAHWAGLILLTTCILFLFSESYIRTIAAFANQMVHSLGLNGGVIRSDGNGLFIILWGKAPWEVSIGIFYLLPFIALCLLSVPPLEKGDAGGFKKVMARFATGTLALFLFHIISVIATYIILLHGGAAWKITAISAALMVSPVIVFGFLFTVFRTIQTGNLKPETENLKPYLTEVLL